METRSTLNFDLREANSQIRRIIVEDSDKVVVNFDKLKDYISIRIYQIEGTATHVVFKNGVPVIIADEILHKAYLYKFDKSIGQWYRKRLDCVKIVCRPNQAVFENYQVNIFYGFKNLKKPYSAYSDEMKNAVDKMNTFIKDIICSGEEDQYEHLIKWLSFMAKGGKNDAILYLKGIEGIGKSTFTDFIKEYVIGNEITGKGEASHLTGDFNKQLMGKILVIFEELSTFGPNQWAGACCKLLDFATGKTCNYSDKYEKKVECENLNNYIINTNMSAIKKLGRRYFVLDLSTKREKDMVYFADIRNRCYNDEVGEAYFNYLLEIDTVGYYAQNMPLTRAKTEATINAMCLSHKFIKEEFILKKIGINKTPSELYDCYATFCNENSKTPLAKRFFKMDLEKVKILTKKSGVNKYKYTYAELDKIAREKGWLDEYDDYIDTTNDTITQSDKICQQELQILELQSEIKSLKEQLEQKCKSNLINKLPKKRDIDDVIGDLLE